MFDTISYEETLNTNRTKIYIDCRSPYEFNHSTIPNAINIPVLLDDERQLVGKLYKSGEVELAKIEGIKAISKRLPDIFCEILKLREKYENMYFFCARGGYRSSALVNLLIGVGIKSYKLSGGYKSYRKYINDNMQDLVESVNFITLYGYTGTGKTSILNELKNMGYNVLNLEKYANHRGSLLGSIGKSEPFSQKKFESLLFDDLKKFKNSYVFVEGESRRIGNIVMSDYIYQKLRSSTKVLISSDMDFRINEIKTFYLNDFENDMDLIEKTILKLEKYISKERIEKYLDCLKKDDFEFIIEDLCVNYYDRNYKLPKEGFVKEYKNDNSIETAKKIANDFAKLNIQKTPLS